ncbi:hypothetical protein AAKU55_002424 [Oxalobacteraceae bacterium GrIS 1.11]
MKLLFLFLFLFLLLAAQAAGAALALPVCTLAPDGKLAVEPCRPAPPKGARRAVPQIIGRMPQQAPVPAPGLPPAYGYRPPAAPAPASAPVPPGPQLPLPVLGCDLGGCRDPAGTRHDGGVGGATLDPSGRLCQRNGVWLQCF